MRLPATSTDALLTRLTGMIEDRVRPAELGGPGLGSSLRTGSSRRGGAPWPMSRAGILSVVEGAPVVVRSL